MLAPTSSTLLVIDDSPTVRQLAANLLRKQGYHVLEAANGREGLDLAIQHQPDLVVCDINMPVLDGWGFVAEARAREDLHTLPILMVTANQDRESARRAMSTGADDYLTKPWTPAELRAAVKALDDKRVRQKAETERSLDRLRGAILATVPHELRTPLTSILGVTQLLIDRHTRYPAERVTDMLRTVHGSATRLARTITRMMEWAELKAARPAATDTLPTLEPADQVALLLADPQFRSDVLAAHTTPVADEDPNRYAGRQVQARLAPGHIRCEPGDFRQMLTELLANAVRFSRADLPIGLTGGPAGNGDYDVEVANVGVAMPPEFARQIGALAQANRDQQEQQGMGLGLAMTTLRAQRNGARLELVRLDGQPTIVRLRFLAP